MGGVYYWLQELAQFLLAHGLHWWAWKIFHGISGSQLHYIYEWAWRHGFRPTNPLRQGLPFHLRR